MPSDAISTDLGSKRRTPQPASANPATMPAGNDATNRPMVAGPAPVASAIAGATGTITLYPVASNAPSASRSG